MEKGLISVDRWDEQSQAYFLTHLHADHTQGLSRRWKRGPLFCSPTTARLFPAKFPGFDPSLIRALEIGSTHLISLVSPSSGSEIVVRVTAIDALHCPGNVAFGWCFFYELWLITELGWWAVCWFWCIGFGFSLSSFFFFKKKRLFWKNNIVFSWIGRSFDKVRPTWSLVHLWSRFPVKLEETP